MVVVDDVTGYDDHPGAARPSGRRDFPCARVVAPVAKDEVVATAGQEHGGSRPDAAFPPGDDG